MRSLIIPNQQAHPNPLLRLVPEKLPQCEIFQSWRQRRDRFPHQLHLVIHRPTDDVDQTMGIQNGMADVFPAPIMLKVHSFLELDLREVPLPHMGILVERHQTSLSYREVGISHAELLGVASDAMVVDGVTADGLVLEGDEKGGLRLGGLAGGVEDGEPFADELAGGDAGSGNGDGADELGAEDVVVLDVENDEGGAVGEGDLEVLVPLGVLGAGDDAGAGNGGAGEGDGDVGVAGDDLRVLALVVGAIGAGAGGEGGGPAGGEAATEVLGEQVHVGEATGLQDPEVEVAMEEDGLRLRGGSGVGSRRPRSCRRGCGGGGP